jgi:hypothetical protein
MQSGFSTSGLAESSKHRLLRDFQRRLIFDSCSSICPKADVASGICGTTGSSDAETLGHLGGMASSWVEQEAIRERAHQLRDAAGRPDGKEAHFWLEAERQLKEDLIRHELKTPDNL